MGYLDKREYAFCFSLTEDSSESMRDTDDERDTFTSLMLLGLVAHFGGKLGQIAANEFEMGVFDHEH